MFNHIKSTLRAADLQNQGYLKLWKCKHKGSMIDCSDVFSDMLQCGIDYRSQSFMIFSFYLSTYIYNIPPS